MAHNPAEAFDFIKVSRDADPVKADHYVYLQKFLKLCVQFKISYNMVAAFVASSIMMNAYPKKMHPGVRIIGIDGGGARGVTPLEFLGELQKLLGDCPIHDMIDLAVGTSSGGLTVLAKFHQKWPVSHCASVFETLARRCFSTSGSALGRLKAVVKYITSDAMYDERFLEGALQETLPGHLFGYVPGIASGTKVALTATSGGNARSIFTNYNGSAQPMGYTVVRPENNDDEALLWQAARATTAAPIFFKPITVASQEFWDGGLGFPNPIELAMWESSRIWGKNISHDVTISLGTGEASKSLPKRKTHSLQRLWTSFMDFLDGHTRYGDIRNGLDEQRRQDFFRLNTELPFPIRLDDVQSIPLQKEQIHLRPQGQLIEVATALLVSNFYFQLDTSPTYNGGFYLCEGSIRCRGVYKDIFNALITLHQPKLEFVTANETLTSLDLQGCQINRHDIATLGEGHRKEDKRLSQKYAMVRKTTGPRLSFYWL
ncbi:hypothetical protein N7471_008338 [Penicillium samsonianum]|uniref:uncharacterized protein n=1 Tax=Penicillium samsonianum TaxID=1882272 RepID=UPI002547CAC1|nr:uncharacterized protein N7471_008338 [Penicillium samsonianum]KAJ6133123.1 hypothetical protein N7471_008338 [Penicillium samsonianum]